MSKNYKSSYKIYIKLGILKISVVMKLRVRNLFTICYFLSISDFFENKLLHYPRNICSSLCSSAFQSRDISTVISIITAKSNYTSTFLLTKSLQHEPTHDLSTHSLWNSTTHYLTTSTHYTPTLPLTHSQIKLTIAPSKAWNDITTKQYKTQYQFTFIIWASLQNNDDSWSILCILYILYSILFIYLFIPLIY